MVKTRKSLYLNPNENRACLNKKYLYKKIQNTICMHGFTALYFLSEPKSDKPYTAGTRAKNIHRVHLKKTAGDFNGVLKTNWKS